MNKLVVELEHCYGIRRLCAEFDFQMFGNVFTVYAANGAMKTSFANTFRDISTGQKSHDRIWPNNIATRKVVDETGTDILGANVFVVEPYSDKYRSNQVSTLLVNEKLRNEYEEVYRVIDAKVDVVLKKLKPFTGLKKSIREEFASAITHDPNGFFTALDRIEKEIGSNSDAPLGDVVYNHIFDPKVEQILKNTDFRKKLQAYIEQYNELITASTFFKKGVFTHNNAADIAKNLKSNGFFDAGHSVSLSINGKKCAVASTKDLEKAIEGEINQILGDPKLKIAFEEIDTILNKNAEHRQLRSCLEANPAVIAELLNLDRLRQKLWVAYFIRINDDYRELMSAYQLGKKKADEVVAKAKEESTLWAHVIDIYNERFSVPFVVRMDNQVEVILRDEAPIIRFDFWRDSSSGVRETTPVDDAQLLSVLSMGERRALYILNIIFEVEARKKAGIKTLFVIDDIADSFDYKNKYAIVEYLQEIREQDFFYQIILTHNFDFHRTVSSRLAIKRQCRRLAIKNENEVILADEEYTKCPFSHWKKHLDQPNMLVAAIPFLRNLAEYSGDDASYNRLTSLLHIKSDTNQFKLSDLQTIITSVLLHQKCPKLGDPKKLVKDIIYERADDIANDSSEPAHLEEKIVMSIAIRLRAEEYMLNKINDEPFWRTISSNQTIVLIKRYRIDFPTDIQEIRLIEQVNLMTPENIHLNSFMYEPILDLSTHHLRKLYKRVCSL